MKIASSSSLAVELPVDRPPATKPLVLLIEDEAIVAADLERVLNDFGYEVQEAAASYEEAMRSVCERRPDLALVDIRIQGNIDGIETAKVLWREYGIPVVYITAYADNETLERAKETQPFGYLVKPFKPREIRSTVEMALHKDRIDRALRERERWLDSVLNSIGDAVLTTDSAGNITFMNSVAEKLAGYSCAEAQGRYVGEILNIKTVPGEPLEPPPWTALRTMAPVRLNEMILTTRDGSERPINDNATPILHENRCLGAVMVFRDVSEEQRLQHRLEKSDRLASLGVMMAGVAHEINNPLTVVASNIHFLLEQTQNLAFRQAQDVLKAWDKWREVLVESSDAVERIREIVSGLTDVARPSSESSSSADVGKAVEWAVHSTATQLRHRARLELLMEPVPRVGISETRLGQVFVNLLLNAAHAIEPGNVDEHRIAIVVGHDQGEVSIEVSDTGHGIPSHLLSRVFEPFVTTKAPGSGTGLGLSVCRDIVASAGGSIEVHSEVGRGTRFALRFPALRSSHQVVRDRKEPQARRRASVLIVDDDAMVGRSLGRLLGVEHDLLYLSTVDAAIAVLEQGRSVDVILCDLVMPHKTGVDFYQYLEASRPECIDRVLFLTGGATSPELQAFLDELPYPPLQKPFDPDALRCRVLEVIERNAPANVTARNETR